MKANDDEDVQAEQMDVEVQVGTEVKADHKKD